MPATHLSRAAIERLREGAAAGHGRCVLLRSDARRYAEPLKELADCGLIRWVVGDPIITDAGLEEIGEPVGPGADLVRMQRRLAVGTPDSSERIKLVVAQVRADVVPPDTRSRYAYASMKKSDRVAFAVVKHEERDGSFVVTRDGGAGRRVCLPKSKRFTTVEPESVGDFLLVTQTRRLANRISQNDKIDLLGVTPSLSENREWTDDERAAWKLITRQVSSLNVAIRSGGRRKPLLTRNQAA